MASSLIGESQKDSSLSVTLQKLHFHLSPRLFLAGRLVTAETRRGSLSNGSAPVVAEGNWIGPQPLGRGTSQSCGDLSHECPIQALVSPVEREHEDTDMQVSPKDSEVQGMEGEWACVRGPASHEQG